MPYVISAVVSGALAYALASAGTPLLLVVASAIPVGVVVGLCSVR